MMRKKFLSLILTFCMVVSLLPVMSITAQAGEVEIWDGTASTFLNVVDMSSAYDAVDNPIAISSGADLAYMQEQVNSGNSATITYHDSLGSDHTITAYNASYQLTTNIVLNENTSEYETWGTNAPANTWTPIGKDDGSMFMGTFDGGNHTISGIYINSTSQFNGMFGFVYMGKIQNLGVIDSYISGVDIIGGVVGYMNGTISNCYNAAYLTPNKTIASSIYLGGVVSYMDGTISDCYNLADITCDEPEHDYRDTGGVVGSLRGTASNCYNTGTIKVTKPASAVGGVVAESSQQKLIGCYNKGKIVVSFLGNSGHVGGVLGLVQDGEIIMADCHNTGDISCTDGYEARVGGILGYCQGYNDLTDCYNTGSIVSTGSRYEDIGGIAGIGLFSKVKNCYNTGNLLGTGELYANVGGIMGTCYGTLKNCYSAGSVNGAASHAGVGGIAGYVSGSSRDCYWLLSAGQTENGSQREDAAKVAIGSYRYSSTTYYAGEADYSTNLASAGIADCYSFSGSDTTWTLSNSTDYSVTPASNGDAITVSSNASLLTALNTWVDMEAYYHWQEDNEYEPDNSGYPVLGIAGSIAIVVTNGYGEINDRICAGATVTATSSTTPDTNLTYQWEVSANGLTGWSDASGSGNNTDIYTVASRDAGKYLRVKITSSDAPRSVCSDAMKVPYLITIVQSGNTTSDAISFSDTASVTTTYATGSAVTIYYTLDNSGKGSNTLCYSGGTITQVPASGTGTSIYTVRDGDASNGIITITANFVHSNSTGSSSSKSSTAGNSSPEASVFINGTAYAAGTEKETTDNGVTVTTVTVDEKKLNASLETQGNNALVAIPITTGSNVASGILTGQMVKNMEQKNATLEIETNIGTYTLSASELHIEAVAETFGADIDLSDISVQITIAQPVDDTVKIVENAAEEGAFAIMVQPVEFTVNCTYGADTTEMKGFDAYVSRMIAIPEDVDALKITTAIVVNKDGTTRHVPTKITMIDGAYYAIINSLTNSVYALIHSDANFTDVEGHWAQDAINDMASRMVVTGMENGTYHPNRAVNRAEFAAIVVRALGLEEGIEKHTFDDVSDSDWYCRYVQTATSYGIIRGYADGRFGPKDQITREQAMTIIARTMAITKLNVDVSDRDITTLLEGYSDSGNVSKYAMESAAACIEAGIISGEGNKSLAPKGNVTRAEVVVIVQRLLQKSKLI